MFSVGCLLLGHDDMMVRSAGRMWLRCQQCGRDTAGWTIGTEVGRLGRRRRDFAGHCRVIDAGPRRFWRVREGDEVSRSVLEDAELDHSHQSAGQ